MDLQTAASNIVEPRIIGLHVQIYGWQTSNKTTQYFSSSDAVTLPGNIKSHKHLVCKLLQIILISRNKSIKDSAANGKPCGFGHLFTAFQFCKTPTIAGPGRIAEVGITLSSLV